MDINNEKNSIYRKRGELPLSVRVDGLLRLTRVFEDMESGLLPVSEQTKKAMQTAIKGICIALSLSFTESD